MGKNTTRSNLWRILTIVFGILLAVVIAVSVWANNYPSIVKSAIGGETSKIIKGDNMNEDTNRYPTNGRKLDDWVNDADDLIQKVQGEGSVLLMNKDNALPLEKGAKVSAFGFYSVKPVSTALAQFGGAGFLTPNFKADMEEDGKLFINPALYGYFENKVGNGKAALRTNSEVDISDISDTERASYAEYGAAAIVVIGRAGGEGNDLDRDPAASQGRTPVRYMAISDRERAIVKEANDHFDKVIIILNGSYATELGWMSEYSNVKACLFVGAVGYTGFRAVSDILTGAVNPSARTVDTFAAHSFSAPAMQNFGDYTFANAAAIDAAVGVEAGGWGSAASSKATKYVVEKEGIYVGYKYYETRYEDSVLNQGNASSVAGAYMGDTWDYDKEVIYPFGYGLSYSDFSYELKGVKSVGETYEVTVKVTNTSGPAGREVVQIYAQTPYTEFDKQNNIEVASVQLVGFGKTGLLEKNGSEELVISVDKEDLAHYDSFVNKTYIMEAGQYYLTAAKDAHSAVNNILKAKGKNVDGNAALVWDGFKPSSTDTYTYSHTDDNVIITNRLDDIDLNYWLPNSVTYLSRKSWDTTWPTEQSTLTANDKMIEALKPLSGYEAGSTDISSITQGANTDYTVAMMIGLPFEHEMWNVILDQCTIDDLVIIVCNSGINAAESVSYPGTFLKDGSHKVDMNTYTEEGENKGKNTHVFPSEVIQACSFDRTLLYEIGIAYAEEDLRTNTTGRYAPSVNIHRTPYSGRNFEYYSEDGYISGEMATQAIIGMQERGIVPTLKHFAFNDQETNRQGVSTFMTQQAAREIYLEAFKAGVVKGKVKGLMQGFNRVGCTWNGAHKGLLTNILREEWGSTATVDTDAGGATATGYMNFLRGIDAGTSMWASSGKISDEINAAVKKDAKALGNLRNSAHYVLYNLVNSRAMNGIASTDKVVPVMAWWQIMFLVLEIVLGLALAAGVFMIVWTEVIRKRKE